MLVYALRRLARGLGSGRSGARQGFALALTAAFSEIPLVSLPDGLKLLKTSLDPITQATKGSEARDILMGQLFGVAALVRAMARALAAGGRRREAVPLAAAVAEEVSALAAAKAYLAESASAVILEIADALGRRGRRRGGTSPRSSSAPRARGLDRRARRRRDAVILALPRSCGRRSLSALRARCDVLPESRRRRRARGGRPKRKRKGGREEEGRRAWQERQGDGGGRGGGVGGVRFSAVCTWRRSRDALAAESSRAHPQTHTVWVLLMDAARTHAIPGALEALWETQVERGLMTSGSHQRRFLGFRLFASAAHARGRGARARALQRRLQPVLAEQPREEGQLPARRRGRTVWRTC